jgi:hypothetical protein
MTLHKSQTPTPNPKPQTSNLKPQTPTSKHPEAKTVQLPVLKLLLVEQG